jgi:hypothetical protein
VTLVVRLAVGGAAVEVSCWLLATALRPGSWRYDISDLYALGAPRPLLVMTGEAAFALALGALVVALHRALPAGDNRDVGCALVALASLGTLGGAFSRDSCDDAARGCTDHAFVTASDWVHAVGGVAEMLGVTGAAIVLATVVPRPWSTYSASAGCAALALVVGWSATPYPWAGAVQRAFALVLAGWVVVLARRAGAVPRSSRAPAAQPARRCVHTPRPRPTRGEPS